MKIYAVFNDKFFKQKPWWLPAKLHRVICRRSNPRPREYMLDALKKTYSGAEVINLADLNETIATQSKLVLLYSDSIGLGWRRQEAKCFHIFKTIEILNGRGRRYKLTALSRFQLLLKRFFEITFLPELAMMPLILICGFALSIKDKIAR